MDPAQLGTTNVLLGVIAGLAVAQTIALVAAAVWVTRTVGRLSQAAARFESERLAPLMSEAQQLGSQARQFITEVHSTAHRASVLVDALEVRARRAMATVDAVNEAVDAVVRTTWSQVRQTFEAGLRRGLSALVRPAAGRDDGVN